MTHDDAAVSQRTVEVGPDGAFAHVWIFSTNAQTRRNQRLLACGIHDHRGGNFTWTSLRRFDTDSVRSVRIFVKEHFDDSGLLATVGALLGSIFKQHLIEFAPHNLPCL